MEKLRTTSTGATEFLVRGMTCQNCLRHVAGAIQSTPGVRSTSVSLETHHATVRWNPGSAKNVSAVVAAVQKAGYEAREIQGGTAEEATSNQAGRQFSLWLGLSITIALMAGEWGFGLAMTPWFQWLAFILAGIVQIVCGAQFYRGAWWQLKAGSSNMDTLVALGSTTAFGYSTWTLFRGAGEHVYFMEAATILSVISAGRWMEARVSEKAGSALKSLLDLAPMTARRIQIPADPTVNPNATSSSQPAAGRRPAEIEAEVPVSDLNPGDKVALRPGDRVPVDGVVLEGESAVDETTLTGESVPVDKKSGGELFAGTTVVNGRLVMRVTATGETTALAHVIAAVQRAQNSRADIQRLGDRISSIFVPAIVLIALAAGIFWAVHSGAEKAFVIASGVLIIACPCAMGLATPAALMAAANAAARRGILIRDGVALEKAGKITVVVFDKTGTLTMGKPTVAAVAIVPPHPDPLPGGEGTASGHNRSPNEFPANPVAGLQSRLDTILPLPAGEGLGEVNEVIRIAAALARNSTHPISRAIAKLNPEGGVPRRPDSAAESADPQNSHPQISDWKEIHGSGVTATLKPSTFNLQPSTLRLGSLRWLHESGVDLAAGENFAAGWTSQGATMVGLSTDKQLLGLFAVQDGLKVDARQVVARLQQQGMKIYLLTGDNSQTAAAIAKQAGIAAENVLAEVRPGQKADFIKKLQSSGERVAFVGDGINDAPALTQADLGIAVSRASDIAREAADIILLKSEVGAVPEALGLARATLRIIKQNLFWAFFYNALGVPLAAAGLVSPIFCAAAMGSSDLIVVGNALRLLRWKQK